MSGAVLAAGSIFARDYRIVTPLGHGGMGSLYVVEQLSTAKRRALKLMHPTLIPSAEHRERFVREAQVGSRIASEHVVEVTAAGIDDESGMPYIVMELLEGETLDAYVKRLGHLAAGEVHAIFQQLCHAMIAAHNAGIVHRDLKPENVFLAVSRRAGGLPFVVKVLDFGIAKLAAEAGTHGTTGAMGSPLWMAPEQTERGSITPAADVWALGLITYFALTGHVFWRAARDPQTTVAQVLREIVLEPIPAATVRANEAGLLDRLPPGFDRFFMRAVVREPQARMQSATAFWGALSSLLDGTGATIPASGPPVTPHPLSPQPLTPQPVTPQPASPLVAPVVGTGSSVSRTVSPTSSAGPWIFAAAAVLALGAVFVSALLFMWQRTRHVGATETVTIQRTSNSAPEQVIVQPATATSTQPPAVTSPPATTAVTTTTRPVPHATATATDNTETTNDTYADGLKKARTWKVGGHTVRVMPGNVRSVGNVPVSVARDVLDWEPWQYLHRCYLKYFNDATSLPQGTVTLTFKIFDQLPRSGEVQHSDFNNPAFTKCVLDTAMGNTANAAGPNGMATVTYPLVFTVID